MKKFRITAQATFVIVTEVEAKTEKEAEQIAQDRDVDCCIHGSEYCDGMTNTQEFSLEDGSCLSFKIDEIDEL